MISIAANIKADEYHLPIVDGSAVEGAALSLDEVRSFPDRFLEKRVVLRNLKFFDFRRLSSVCTVGVYSLVSGSRVLSGPEYLPGRKTTVVPQSIFFVLLPAMEEDVVGPLSVMKYARGEMVFILRPHEGEGSSGYLAVILAIRILDADGEPLHEVGIGNQESVFDGESSIDTPVN